MGYLLAVDQGGTKTIALVADFEGKIHGVGTSEGACHAFDGMHRAMETIREACDLALQQAAVNPADIKFLLSGMTGADWPHEYPLLQNALYETFHIAEIAVVNDCMVARRGGTDQRYGAVLCIGTGLNAAIITPDGQEFVYGYYVDDGDGGGTALGKKAIRAVFDAELGFSEPTKLTEVLLNHFHLPSVDSLLYQFVNKGLGKIKDLAPLLFEVARLGDRVARNIIDSFGNSVSRYITAGLRRFNMLDMEIDIVLSGSICKPENDFLQQVISTNIKRSVPRAHIINAIYEPVVGAMLMALDTIHKRTFPMNSPTVRSSAEKFGLLRY